MGARSLRVALRTHRPLDLVVIMLGTNDKEARFNLLPADIACGAAELGKLVESFDYGADFPTPKVLLVSPIHLGEGVENSCYTGFAPRSRRRLKSPRSLLQSAGRGARLALLRRLDRCGTEREGQSRTWKRRITKRWREPSQISSRKTYKEARG